MTRLYTQFPGNGSVGILQKRLDQFLEGSADQLNVREELALVKSALQDRVIYYAETLKSGTVDQKMLAGQLMAEQAEKVIHLAEKIAKTEAFRSEAITQDSLMVLIRQIADLIYEKYPEDLDKCEQVVGQIEAMVGLGGGDAIGERELLELMTGTVPLAQVKSAIDVEFTELSEGQNGS